MITTQQLQLLKEGNKNAFEALYRAYNARISPNMVYYYVRRELLLQNYVDKLSNTKILLVCWFSGKIWNKQMRQLTEL